jgi:hypothetical protein
MEQGIQGGKVFLRWWKSYINTNINIKICISKYFNGFMSKKFIKMTLYEFSLLDELEQVEALWEHGVHIGDRIEGEYRLILYQLFSFYLEAWYHMEHTKIEKYRTFSSTDQLQPYLCIIDLQRLLK